MYLEEKIAELEKIIIPLLDKKIVVWGTGIHTEQLVKHTSLLKCIDLCFVDKSKKYTSFFGRPVVLINKEMLEKADYIIISSYMYSAEMNEQINAMGLSDKAINLYGPNDEGEFYHLPSVKNNGYYFEGNYATWEEAKEAAIGYDEPSIAEKVYLSTQKVIAGEATYERDSVCFNDISYNYRLLFVLAMAGGISRKINVLDFGGSLGSEYWRHRKIIDSEGIAVSWNVVEQKNYVQFGKQLDCNEVDFYSSIDDYSKKQSNTDVLVFSGVMQFLDDWRAILNEALSLTPHYLLIERQPVADKEIICVQHVGEQIYNASYATRIIAKNDLINFIKSLGYKIISEFGSDADGDVHYVEAKSVEYRGWIFERVERGK